MKDIPVVIILNTGAWRIITTPIVTMALLGDMRGEVATMTHPMVTVGLLRGMTKGTTTDTIIVLIIIMLDKEAWRIIMSRTEMNCQKVCVYVLGVGKKHIILCECIFYGMFGIA